jgi:hypothetical protein
MRKRSSMVLGLMQLRCRRWAEKFAAGSAGHNTSLIADTQAECYMSTVQRARAAGHHPLAGLGRQCQAQWVLLIAL